MQRHPTLCIHTYIFVCIRSLPPKNVRQKISLSLIHLCRKMLLYLAALEFYDFIHLGHFF